MERSPTRILLIFYKAYGFIDVESILTVEFLAMKGYKADSAATSDFTIGARLSLSHQINS